MISRMRILRPGPARRTELVFRGAKIRQKSFPPKKNTKKFTFWQFFSKSAQRRLGPLGRLGPLRSLKPLRALREFKIQNAKFKIQNCPPSKYSSPTIGEAGRGGRNCARRPRRAGGREGWSKLVTAAPPQRKE